MEDASRRTIKAVEHDNPARFPGLVHQQSVNESNLEQVEKETAT